jgi:hypothetical protein
VVDSAAGNAPADLMVSVLIVSFNAVELLRACLHSLEQQRRVEIVVVICNAGASLPGDDGCDLGAASERVDWVSAFVMMLGCDAFESVGGFDGSLDSRMLPARGVMKVALVHDWLVAQRGGEKVLLELANLFPDAPVFTLVHDCGEVHPDIESHKIRTSFIQKLPGSPKRFRRFLPLFPKAIECFDLSSTDLVVSTSHCVAMGVGTHMAQRHLSYVHTPMRYVWDQMAHYLPKTMPPHLAKLLVQPLRRRDVRSAKCNPARLFDCQL